MADDDQAAFTIVQAQRKLAVKKRMRSAHGKETKSDPTQNEYFWRIRQYWCPADVDKIVAFRLNIALRRDLATVYGDPAPGLDPNGWHRRLSAESWGQERTLRSAPRNYIICDFDDAPLAADSPLIKAENLPALAEHGHDNWLPPALRDTDMAIAASSSTGFKASYHGYLVLPELVPQQTIYNYFFGAKAAHFPLDPKPMLPGQLFLTGRPLFWGLDDPVPEHLRAFVLRGRRRYVTEIDWYEFDEPAAVYKGSEHRARAEGAAGGWREVLKHRLGYGEGGLGFHDALTIALGYAARSDEPADEIVGAMHAMVIGHADYGKRSGEYSEHWLRAGLKNLRAKDAARAASIDAQITAVRARLSGMGFRA